MDFMTYNGETENGLINGDLMLDSAFNDLAVDETEIAPIMANLRELFEMTMADDLSHPEIHSGQRAFMDTDDVLALSQRKTDAARLLKSMEEIDPDSIYITIQNGIMNVEFSTYNGTQGALQL